jgi:MbtH protein
MSEGNIPGAATHTVLINDEGQYSLWPIRKPVPDGWRAVDKQGSEEECMKYVDEVWTDMRPISLRKRMQQQAIAVAHRGEH